MKLFGREFSINNLEFINKADSYFEKQQYSIAIEAYNKAEKNDKTNYYIYFKRGKSYQMLSQFDKAISDYMLGQMLDDNFDISRGLGECYLMKSDFENGLKFLQKAFDKLSDLENAEKIGRSESEFKSASLINYSWNKANLMNNLAVAYYNLGRVNAAVDCLKKGINYDSSYPGNYGITGSILLEKGDVELAIDYFRKAASLGDERSKSILKELL